MIKLRLEGTREEIAFAIERIGVVLRAGEPSRFYPNLREGLPGRGRVYVEVELPSDQVD